MFWIYILRCADGSYYTGHTDSLQDRLGKHHRWEIPGYTTNRRPLQLVHQQSFATREEALQAEQRVKGWSRRKKEAMIRGDWVEVSKLAKGKAVHPLTSSGRTAGAAQCSGSPDWAGRTHVQ